MYNRAMWEWRCLLDSGTRDTRERLPAAGCLLLVINCVIIIEHLLGRRYTKTKGKKQQQDILADEKQVSPSRCFAALFQGRNDETHMRKANATWSMSMSSTHTNASRLSRARVHFVYSTIPIHGILAYPFTLPKLVRVCVVTLKYLSVYTFRKNSKRCVNIIWRIEPNARRDTETSYKFI